MIEPATSLLRPKGAPSGGLAKTWPRSRSRRAHGFLKMSLTLLLFAGLACAPGLARAEDSVLKPDPPPRDESRATQVGPDTQQGRGAGGAVATPPAPPVSSVARETPATRSGKDDSAGGKTAPTTGKRPESKVKSYPRLTPERRYGFVPDLSALASTRRTHLDAAPPQAGARSASRDSTLLLVGVLVLSLLVLGSGNLLRLLLRRSPEAQVS
jgi:hypothetical protein